MRTKPLVALFGIVVGATLAVVLWKGWRELAGRFAPEPASDDFDRDGRGEGQAPSPETAPPAPATAAPPFQPIPPPMPFGTVFDPLAAVDDSPALYDEIEGVAEDEVASTLSAIGDTAGATELTEAPATPDAAQAETPIPTEIGSPQRRFGPGAAPPIERGICPDEFPVKGNASSMIYHLPGQSTYAATIPEVCFRDADAAEAAGFRARKR